MEGYHTAVHLQFLTCICTLLVLLLYNGHIREIINDTGVSQFDAYMRLWSCLFLCACVCVCESVRERGRETEKERERKTEKQRGKKSDETIMQMVG